MKKTLIVLGVWILAIVLIAALVVSMGFSFPEALLIGVLFLPGALAARFFLPKISFEPRKAGIRDSVFVLLAILITETALIVLANLYILRLRKIFLFEYNDYSPTLFNPIFIAGVLTLLVLVDWALKRYLEKSFPAAREPIRFISDRKPVSLLPEEIRYIESNDKEVMVYATEGRRFRNKTGISQWESILGDGFVRIHRSYLVNRAAITSVGPDSLTASGQTLPISRKYRNSLSPTD